MLNMNDSILDQLPLIDEGGQLVLPSPKMKSKSKEGVQSWSHAYAGFSNEFAISAIKALNDKDNLMFFDPFSGSGTSAVAAFHENVSLTAIDLDPFSALLTRAKVAKNYDKSKIFKYLSGSTRSIGDNFSVEARNLFLDIDLKYANNVFKNIVNESSSNTSELWDKFLNDPYGKYDTEVIALASMVIASRGCAKVARGSNPVWLRQLLDNEVHEHIPLRKLTKDFAQKMMVDLSLLKDDDNETTIQVLNSDFLDKNTQVDSIDRRG